MLCSPGRDSCGSAGSYKPLKTCPHWLDLGVGGVEVRIEVGAGVGVQG